MLINCNECGNLISSTATYCPHCGCTTIKQSFQRFDSKYNYLYSCGNCGSTQPFVASASGLQMCRFCGIANGYKQLELKPKISKSISLEAFACHGLEDISRIVIPDSITTIGVSAFMHCKSLISVNLSNVKHICDFAFNNCEWLSVIKLTNIEHIGNSAFCGCSHLKKIPLSDKLTEIGSHAFAGCTSLQSIHIPNSVTKIGNYAFDGCYSLTDVVAPARFRNLFPQNINFRSC